MPITTILPDPNLLEVEQLHPYTDIHFNFEDLYDLVDKDENMKRVIRSFGEGGICWALSMVNAKGVLEFNSDPQKPIEDIRQTQNETLFHILSKASKKFTTFDEFRTAVLKGEYGIPVDSRTGGFSSEILFPVPAPSLNNLLKIEFGVCLAIWDLEVKSTYPNILWELKEGSPYLMSQIVNKNVETSAHAVTVVRKGSQIIFFEPNAPKPIIVPVNYIYSREPIYWKTTEAGKTFHFYYEKHPLLEVRLANDK